MIEEHPPASGGPWWEPPLDNRQAVAAELLIEVGLGHPLHGREVTVISRCSACDEVLIRIGDADFGLVHLTWSRTRERPPYPRYSHTGARAETESALEAHAAEHGGE